MTINGNCVRWRAGARRPFPARRLHLIDIENLAGEALPSLPQVRTALSLYTRCLPFSNVDQVVVASSHLTLVNAALGWPRAHHLVRSGPDGADLALLDVVEYENIAQRFTHVAIGSGDGGFADAAARLAAQGVWVTVVSWERSLSWRLAAAACDVIYLDAAAEVALRRAEELLDAADAARGAGMNMAAHAE